MRVCVFAFKPGSQDLSNDVFSGVAREMPCLLAVAVAPCCVSMTVTVCFHWQKGWGQHAQMTLRRAESFLRFQVPAKISQAPLRFLTWLLRAPPWSNSWSFYINNFVFSKQDV